MRRQAARSPLASDVPADSVQRRLYGVSHGECVEVDAFGSQREQQELDGVSRGPGELVVFPAQRVPDARPKERRAALIAFDPDDAS